MQSLTTNILRYCTIIWLTWIGTCDTLTTAPHWIADTGLNASTMAMWMFLVVVMDQVQMAPRHCLQLECCQKPVSQGGAKEDRLGYVLWAPAVDGLINAGVILMHELMGRLKQEVDAMEDSSHNYVILGACHMKVVLLPTYKVVVGHKWWVTEDVTEDPMLGGKEEEALMLLLPQLRSDGRRLHNILHDGQQQFVW